MIAAKSQRFSVDVCTECVLYVCVCSSARKAERGLISKALKRVQEGADGPGGGSGERMLTEQRGRLC